MTLQDAFHRDYASFRETMVAALAAAHPRLRRSDLLRVAQRLSDRYVALLFAGTSVHDRLARASTERGFDEGGEELRRELERHFDGGPFEREEQLDSLRVPNHVFCGLLHLAASYEFGEGPRAIGLATLSRTFEQSITDLERMEALTEDQPRRVSRRKREGIFYTPDWITAHVVEETLGRRLEELRPTDMHPAALDEYAARLDTLTVLDPACGAGVFLIAALRRLLDERRWIARQRERISKEPQSFDPERAARATIANNLYGVDLSAEAIERAKLALWLHGARGTEHHLFVANSLLEDWRRLVPEVLDCGGFDCILANPPYVKYQHLRRADEAFAEQLRRSFASTASGNFDLYIPFIEKGLELLHARGRMGLIAPSLWIKQAYGEPLRRLVRAGRHLERWLDFGDAQVFEDATTYTSLQFYSKAPAPGVQYVEVHESHPGAVSWDHAIAYAELPDEGPWTFASPAALRLIQRLQARFPALADTVKSISVGVQTSADKIYHCAEIAPGRYRTESGEFEFERYVRPLLSGADVRRYVTPSTSRRILFPYLPSGELVPVADLRRTAPGVWAYLERHEQALRGRERGRFDDDEWYRFGRRQNIDKQHLAKVLIPRLVRRLTASADSKGKFVADNVDVCFLIPKQRADLDYLVGVLNCAVADFVFRTISKPFRGGYRSANKQYLAPIPIPMPTQAQRARVRELVGAQLEHPGVGQQAELDRLCFSLYELTEQEVALIRSATA